MSHIRTQIRTAVVAKFKGITGVRNVYDNLRRRPDQDEVPLINVTTPAEASAWQDDSRDMERTLTIRVIIIGAGRTVETQDEMDRVAVEIEKRLYDTDLAGLLQDDAVLTATEFVPISEGAEDFAFLSLTFEARYFTLAGNPESV